MAVQKALDLSALNLNGEGIPVYNLNFARAIANGWRADHEATGGPGGTPCVKVTLNSGAEQQNVGWAINPVGGSYTQGVSNRYMRIVLQFDPTWVWSTGNAGRGGNNKFIEWGGGEGRCIMYLVSPADAGSRLSLDAVNFTDEIEDPNDTTTGGIFEYCRPDWFGLSASPNRFLSSTLPSGTYGAMSPSKGVGGEVECGRPILLHRSNLGTPVRPGPSGLGAAPVGGWYYIQVKAQSGGTGTGGGRFISWCNNNDVNNPTAAHPNDWYIAGGLDVSGWGDQQIYIGGYVDTAPTQDLIYRIAAFEIGDTFDPNWYPGGAVASPRCWPRRA
jgi:hypothetical protein